jgi:hypothetical protein
VRSGNGTRAPDGRSCQVAKQPARTAWRSQKTVSGCILADGAASLSFACRAGKRRSRKTAFRLAFASTISDGPRTARCLLPGQGGTAASQTSNVVKINPATLKFQELVRHPDIEGFGVTTVAIQVANELWLGSVCGDRIAIFPFIQSPPLQ